MCGKSPEKTEGDEKRAKMSARYKITELSFNRMVITKAGGQSTVYNFATLKNWAVGDDVITQSSISPHDLDFVDGRLVIIRPPELHNEWKREFYTVRNLRTKDWVTVDFDQVEGSDKLKK